MAGAILVSKSSGVSLNSVDFDYILEKIRPNFKDEEAAVREDIYSPVDDAGLSFISLVEKSVDEFNAFFRAASIGYEKELRNHASSIHKTSWEELMTALRADPRAKKS